MTGPTALHSIYQQGNINTVGGGAPAVHHGKNHRHNTTIIGQDQGPGQDQNKQQGLTGKIINAYA